MLQTYSRALAPGTYENRAKQARCYIQFAVLYNVSYLSPSPTHVCMYSQYLANKFHTVSSVKNYLSGARSWIVDHGGNITSFLGHENNLMLKSLTKDSAHVVKRAFPLSLFHISAIASYLDLAANAPLCLKPCILIGFSCYLRSSNLLATTISAMGGPHALLARNVKDCGHYLRITIVSTKSRRIPYSLTLPTLDNPSICPVLAWRNYKSRVQLPPNGPEWNSASGVKPYLLK